MQVPRQSFLVSLLIAVVAVPIVAVGRAAFKAIFDVTVQDYWKDTVAPFLQAHVGPWSTAMLEWIGPFWSGVGSAFALMFVVKMVFAWRRRHRRASEASARTEPPQIVKAPRTLIRLRFSGRTEQPEELTKENVACWFVYWSQEFKMSTPEGQPIYHLPPTWFAFVLFEKPVDYKQATVNFIGDRPDRWQVRQISSMSAIVTMDSPMPPCEMEIVTRS